jgi:hypothetical protein
MLRWDVNRREFLKIAVGAGAALTMPSAGRSAGSSKMIGIQVGAISFVDEGTEKVLDVLQERACVNTLFLAVFTYGRGIAGRQIPGQPLPDHGKQQYDLNFHGGNFATPHPQYYKNTVLKDTRAPDHGDLDILAEVLPAAKKRGMKVILLDGGRVPHRPAKHRETTGARSVWTERRNAVLQQSRLSEFPDRARGRLYAFL